MPGSGVLDRDYSALLPSMESPTFGATRLDAEQRLRLTGHFMPDAAGESVSVSSADLPNAQPYTFHSFPNCLRIVDAQERELVIAAVSESATPERR
jgi:hypothetical protein